MQSPLFAKKTTASNDKQVQKEVITETKLHDIPDLYIRANNEVDDSKKFATPAEVKLNNGIASLKQDLDCLKTKTDTGLATQEHLKQLTEKKHP